jgi:hypothetical protein
MLQQGKKGYVQRVVYFETYFFVWTDRPIDWILLKVLLLSNLSEMASRGLSISALSDFSVLVHL